MCLNEVPQHVRLDVDNSSKIRRSRFGADLVSKKGADTLCVGLIHGSFLRNASMASTHVVVLLPYTYICKRTRQNCAATEGANRMSTVTSWEASATMVAMRWHSDAGVPELRCMPFGKARSARMLVPRATNFGDRQLVGIQRTAGPVTDGEPPISTPIQAPKPMRQRPCGNCGKSQFRTVYLTGELTYPLSPIGCAACRTDRQSRLHPVLKSRHRRVGNVISRAG